MMDDFKLENIWPDGDAKTLRLTQNHRVINRIIISDGEVCVGINVAKGDAIKLRDALNDWINK